MMFSMPGKFDCLQGVAHVVVHEFYHFKPSGQIGIPAALHQEADQGHDNSCQKVIPKSLQAGEPKMNGRLVHQNEKREDNNSGSNGSHRRS